MAKSKLSWVWSERDGEIIIHKDKGRLTMDDIFNFLHQPEQLRAFDGMLAVIMFRVSGDREEPFSLYGIDRDEGDDQAVMMVGDYNVCPLCGKNELYTQYCPDCGAKLWKGRSSR